MWSIPFGKRGNDRQLSRRDKKQHAHRRSARKTLTLEKLEDRYLLAGDVLYQINVGGESLLGATAWQADTTANPSAYTNAAAALSKTFQNPSAINLSHPSVPAGTPEALFHSERYDKTTGDEMRWDFAVTPGTYEVRLFFAETYDAAQTVGARQFDVSIEGQQVLDNYDIYAEVGGYTGVVKSFIVDSNSNLDIDFAHAVQNPALKGIQILTVENVANQLGSSTSQVNFGSVVVAESASQTIQLTNLGQSGDPSITFDPGTASLSGADATSFGFSFASGGPITLAPGESTNVVVTFDPTATAPHSATLNIPHGGDNSPLQIGFVGQGAAFTEFNWSSATDSPINRTESARVILNDKIYIFGGFHNSNLNASTRVDVYDPLTDSWTRLADMPTKLTHITPAADGNTIWIAGGYVGDNPGTGTDDVWKYDVVSNSWSQGPDLPAIRAGGGLAVVGRELHYFSGLDADRQTNHADHWVLDLDTATTWTTAAAMPSPRDHFGTAVLDGIIYAVGGQFGHDGSEQETELVHTYDTTTDSWTQVASLPFARSHHEGGTFVYADHIIVLGGQTNQIDNSADIRAYDPVTDTWKTLPALPVGLNGTAAAVIDDLFIVATGTINDNRTPIKTVYVAPWNSAALGIATSTPTSTAESFVEVDPGRTIDDASTYTSDSFKITNLSPDGQKITSVRFDLSTAILPDLVFDPDGTAGDPVGKDVTIDSGNGQTGYTSRAFSAALHGGYQTLELFFDDFAAGDQVTFSVDIDPSSILGAAQPGPEHSGSVSGLEMTGSLVTVTYDDGTVQTVQLYREPNSNTGGQNAVTSVAVPAPTIELLNVPTTPTTLTGANQTVRITGPAGASVQLLLVEAALHLDGVPNGGFDVDAYEANKAILVNEQSVTIGAGGFVDVPITLTRTHADGGLNYIAAVVKNASGQTSDVAKLVVEYDPSASNNQPPSLASLSNRAVLEGGTIVIPVTATDPNGNAIMLSANNFPSFATLSDNGNGTGTITITPQQGNAGSYSIAVTATDNGTPALSDTKTFSLTVAPLVTGGEVVYRVNAGGSTISDNPSWQADTSTNPSNYTNASSAKSKTFQAVTSIDLSHTSLASGTPEAIFHSERYDKTDGGEMQWDFAVTSGTYEVRLYFAETYAGAQSIGVRQFDVAIEGQQVLDDYDIFADVGGYKGVAKSFIVTSDSNLDIDFNHVLQNPALKAIEILTVGTSSNVLGSTTSQIAFGNVSPGETASQVIQLTNLGGSGDPAITFNPSSASFVGTHASVFNAVFASNNPITLVPGQSTSVTIRYNPNTSGAMNATLNIPHSGNNAPLSIAVNGVGAFPPIGFGKSTLAGTSSSLPTSIQFGPDDRLYVAQQDGLIKIYTIERNGANNYQVLSTETITSIQSITNHDDDGAVNPSVNTRLVTGIVVAGTAANPVIYVSSSDPRIGAGQSGQDLNLDTNSGTISRLTWNGSSWIKLDLVRGLPRSEENHATNGLQLDEATNTLYVAQGGNTNMGAPSNNFANNPEYALSAAILSIDLNAIGETTYDLPTLDDETRAGTNDDGRDPFGGNDGKNQAILVPGGPVQVYAPGFRNPYDVVFTELGRLYSVDNGPNAGWGGVPKVDSQGRPTNQSNEPGMSYGDNLHYITGQGYYAGHPNPTRANTNNTFNSSNPQSPVSVSNVVESNYLIPGVQDGALVVYPASTNGLTEYTASNFGGAMRGDLLAASFDNSIKRVKLDAEGDDVLIQENLFNSVSVVPLDVTAVGDNGLFPGTIWVVDIVTGAIIAFEPSDFAGSGGGGPINPNDLDGDGYTNDDEAANGTNPNSAADFPADFDSDFVSNLLDNDDDNDNLLDHVDPFAIDPNNGTTTPVGVSYQWENETSGAGGLFNLGFTGLMTNGSSNYQSLYDEFAVTAGGAAGVFTIDSIGEGDATGSLNTQEQAFQFGVNVAAATTPVTAHTRVIAPFAGVTPQGQQSMGMFIGTGDQDNYVKIVATANNGTPGITMLTEIGGIVTNGPFAAVDMSNVEAVDFYLTVDNASNTVQASYEVTINGVRGTRTNLGSLVAIPQAWINGNTGMAVGLISTSVGSAPPISATWDFLEVIAEGTSNVAPVLTSIANRTMDEGSTLVVPLAATDANGDQITFSHSGLPSFATLSDNGNGTGLITFNPTANDAGTYTITVTATDNGTPTLADSDSFTLTVNAPVVITPGGEVVYRVNAGGSTIAGSPSWQADTTLSPSQHSNVSSALSKTTSVTNSINMSHASIPVGTPAAIFQSERYDKTTGGEMQWNFAVEPGTYEVRLYFAETYEGAQAAGIRAFDVTIEGQLVLDNYDVFADVGGYAGVVKTFIIESDGNIDIDFAHVAQNPAIKAIEILTAGGGVGSQAAGPVLDAIGNQIASEGETNEITITSTGQSLSHNGLPSFATLTNIGNGDGTLTLAPTTGDAGTYSVTIVASDNGDPAQTASETITITVAAPLADGTIVYRVNAGGQAVAGNPDWQGDVVTAPSPTATVQSIAIGSRLELFIDGDLFESLSGTSFQQHSPTAAATVVGQHAAGAYPTILFDGTTYYHYYRDVVSGTVNAVDGTNAEVYRVETSTDGIHWTQPVLNLFDVQVIGPNNVVLAYDAPSMHNFMPFFDTNPDVDPQHKFKAVAGLSHVDNVPNAISGIRVYSSPDGINWSLMANDPVITVADLPGSNDTFGFDTANVAFWSELEQKYVIYYRTWSNGKPGGNSLREISRAVSNDFITWTNHTDVTANLPGEHLYTSTVNPYFRAPQLYVGMPTQFLPNGQSQNTQIMFMTSRDGLTFDRTFGSEVFINGDSGNRQNYAAPRVVQTGSNEMSIYGINGVRYTMRLDGFSSLDTTGKSGQALTKPISFAGDALNINFTTGSGGSIRVELLDGFGNVIPGFSLADSDAMSGNDIARTVTWNGNSDLSKLSGQPIKVRFVMQNADLYTMQFDGPDGIWLPPQISIPKGFVAVRGTKVTVPIQLSVEHPAGVDVTSVTAAIAFDSNAFSVSNVRTAAALAGFNLDVQLNNAAGTLIVTATGPSKNLVGANPFDLILADFTVHGNSRLGDVAIDLQSSLNGSATAINGGTVTLARAPSNNADDFVDGRVSIAGSYTNVAQAGSKTSSTTSTINTSHPSVPAGTPQSIFQTERYDKTDLGNMQWDFHVAAGTYEVRLYFAETYAGAQTAGVRQFDVTIEGQLVLDNYDVYADVGGYTGVVKNFIVTSDTNLDIDFSHVSQNPALKAIEIVAVGQ